MIHLGPETEREAAEELGYRTRGAQRDHLQALVAEVEAKHRDLDLDAIAWGPWVPARVWGPSSWQAEGVLATSSDTLVVQIVTSEDHEPVVTSHWRSNGREPAAWTLDDLRDAALEHAATAPTEEREHASQTTARRPVTPFADLEPWSIGRTAGLNPVGAGSTPAGSAARRGEGASIVASTSATLPDSGASDDVPPPKARPEPIGVVADRISPQSLGPGTARGGRPLAAEDASRSSGVEGREGAKPSAGSEHVVPIHVRKTEPTPRGPTPAAPTSAGDTPPGSPARGSGAHPARPTHRAAALSEEVIVSVSVCEPVNLRLVPDEIKPRLRQWQELWALLEAPPPGVDVSANVAAYVAEGGEDLVLALALYLRSSLEPAIATGRAERSAIGRAVKRNKAEREWVRDVIGQMLDRLGVDRLAGPTIRLTRTDGQEHVEQDPSVDLDLLDDELVRRTAEPKLDEIAKRLRAGQPVPGFRLTRKPGVMIR